MTALAVSASRSDRRLLPRLSPEHLTHRQLADRFRATHCASDSPLDLHLGRGWHLRANGEGDGQLTGVRERGSG